MDFVTASTGLISPYWMGLPIRYIQFKISVFGLSSVFYTSCTKKEPYPFIGKTHKFKNLLNLMTLDVHIKLFILCIITFYNFIEQEFKYDGDYNEMYFKYK